MYRCDKQFMKNPATASSRIYVGNLAENIKPEDLDQKFSQHGHILGLVVQRGFGFVQFEADDQAKAAIANEHGAMFFGKKLNVKQALDNTNKNKQGGNQHQNRGNQNNQMGNQNQFNPHHGPMMNHNQNMNNNSNQNMNQPNNFPNQGNFKPEQGNNFPNTFQSNQNNLQNKMNQNPMQNKGDNFSNNDSSSNKPPQTPAINQSQTSPHPQSMNMGMDNQNQANMNRGMNIGDDNQFKRGKPNRNRGGRGGGRQGMNHDFRSECSDQGDYMEDMEPGYFEGPYASQMGPGPAQGRRMGPEDHGRPGMGSSRMGPGSDSYHSMGPEKPERNDCEIIVISKALTEYAEYIEHRLKDLGLIVDLLFPNDDVPIGRVLANISSRGCLFAILIMPTNEDHRSLTLNILHGIPEEHRNMPIEDALHLITRNFDAYMRGDKAVIDKDKLTLSSKHPEHIQIIANLLAENRQLASHYYDKLITYLQEKRELQYKYEIAEGLESGIEPETKNRQADLQNRIMNILNKKMDEPLKTETETTPIKEEPTPLLTDPSVRKALDSLMLGDMFKNLV